MLDNKRQDAVVSERLLRIVKSGLYYTQCKVDEGMREVLEMDNWEDIRKNAIAISEDEKDIKYVIELINRPVSR